MNLSEAYHLLFSVGLCGIGVCLIFSVIKSVIGPRISDRLVNVNMIGTLVTSAIVILSVLLSGEAYLLDVAMIYVLISFLSVVVFTNVFINEYLKKKNNTNENKEKEDEKP